jgi:hypothetical protein
MRKPDEQENELEDAEDDDLIDDLDDPDDDDDEEEEEDSTPNVLAGRPGAARAGTKRAFVLTHIDKEPDEVLRLAREQGLTISKSTIYAIRGVNKNGPRERKAATTPKAPRSPRAPKAKPPTRSITIRPPPPKVIRTHAPPPPNGKEKDFIALVISIGTTRSREWLDTIEKRMLEDFGQ